MMKAFGSCPPEYRIMAVWIFIFLTLLYMILLICEGTGERKKKAMLQDSLLLIAAFLITSGLCVRQGFYEEEDFMVFLKMPVSYTHLDVYKRQAGRQRHRSDQ